MNNIILARIFCPPDLSIEDYRKTVLSTGYACFQSENGGFFKDVQLPLNSLELGNITLPTNRTELGSYGVLAFINGSSQPLCVQLYGSSDSTVSAIDSQMNIIREINGTICLLSLNPSTNEITLSISGGSAKVNISASGANSVINLKAVAVNIESSKIALNSEVVEVGYGKEKEAAVLGQKLSDLLSELLQEIQLITVGTAVGNSTPPINSAKFSIIGKKITTILSKVVKNA